MKEEDQKEATREEKKGQDGFVVIDGNRHAIAVGSYHKYEILFEEEHRVNSMDSGKV